MPPPAEMSGQLEKARQQSRAAWGAVARGWYAQREELWKASRPVSEWMIRRLDPKPEDTVLELAAGLADTGLMAARFVGESGRVIVTDFTPEMVAAAPCLSLPLCPITAQNEFITAVIETEHAMLASPRWAQIITRASANLTWALVVRDERGVGCGADASLPEPLRVYEGGNRRGGVGGVRQGPGVGLGRCALAGTWCSCYPSPQLSTTSTSTFTGTRSRLSVSRPELRTSSIPATIISSVNIATCSAFSLGHATTNSPWAR
jgi:hypothetical protein